MKTAPIKVKETQQKFEPLLKSRKHWSKSYEPTKAANYSLKPVTSCDEERPVNQAKKVNFIIKRTFNNPSAAAGVDVDSTKSSSSVQPKSGTPVIPVSENVAQIKSTAAISSPTPSETNQADPSTSSVSISQKAKLESKSALENVAPVSHSSKVLLSKPSDVAVNVSSVTSSDTGSDTTQTVLMKTPAFTIVQRRVGPSGQSSNASKMIKLPSNQLITTTPFKLRTLDTVSSTAKENISNPVEKVTTNMDTNNSPSNPTAVQLVVVTQSPPPFIQHHSEEEVTISMPNTINPERSIQGNGDTEQPCVVATESVAVSKSITAVTSATDADAKRSERGQSHSPQKVLPSVMMTRHRKRKADESS